MPQHCARCEAVLVPVEGEEPAFCVHCGLPQLRVSEAVLDAAAGPGEAANAASMEHERAAAVGDRHRGAALIAAPDGGLDWRVMLRVLLLATAVGMLPALLLRDVLFGGAIGIAVVFLLPLLGLASGTVYLRWRPRTRMTAGVGAQMGLALGTMLAFAESTVTGIASFALRYGRHNLGLQQNFDAVMQQAMAQVRATQPDASAGLLAAMQTPEWHAGWFLAMEGALMLLLVAAGAVCGLVAGALLSARQRAAQNG